jgi:hypothetical protein
MKPRATFNENDLSVELVDGNKRVTLSLAAVDAIIDALRDPESDEALPTTNSVHHAVGIGAEPSEGALSVRIYISEGTRHTFIFEAPGRSIEHVKRASYCLEECFEHLFAIRLN